MADPRQALLEMEAALRRVANTEVEEKLPSRRVLFLPDQNRSEAYDPSQARDEHGRCIRDEAKLTWHDWTEVKGLDGLVWHDWTEVKGFDPEQPRDEAGRWTDTGGGTAQPKRMTEARVNERVSEIRDKLDDPNASAEEYKARITDEIATRLRDNPAFKEMVATGRHNPMLKPMWDREADPLKTGVSILVNQWAGTSGDGDRQAVAMQLAVQREFGLDNSSTSHFLSEDLAGTMEAAERDYAKNGDAYRAFARAMYDNTQAELKAQGISSLTLYRGMGWDHAEDARAAGFGVGQDVPATETINVTQQPASSWSFNPAVAVAFSSGRAGTVMASEVPAERILSTMRSGIGCKDEGEVVVLGGQDKVNAWTGSGNFWSKEDAPQLAWMLSRPGATYHAKTVVQRVAQFKDFNPDQPRDESGRWTVGAGDVTQAPTGKESGQARLQAAEAALNDQQATREAYKARIATEIAARADKDPRWVKFKDYVAPNPRDPRASEKLASQLVEGWAQTSADDSGAAIAMQQAVKDEFGLQDATLDHVSQATRDRAAEFANTKRIPGDPTGTYSEGYRAFVRAMYDNTQADLAAKGLTEMTIYRGMHFARDAALPPGLHAADEPYRTTVVQQPASSWSYAYPQATTFSSEAGSDYPGAVMAATVPASRILSTMNSGFGCKPEREVVLLGGKDEVTAQAWNAGGAGPPKSTGPLLTVKLAVWLSLELKFSEDQPRDERGRWAATGAPTASAIEAFGKPGWSKEGIVAQSRRDEADRALNDHSASRPEDKIRIAQELSDRLKDNPAWKEYLTRAHPVSARAVMFDVLTAHVPSHSETAASSLVQLWAQSSGDNRPQAVAMQMAIRDEFGLKDAVTDHLGVEGARPDYEANGAAYRAFARAMYDNTQADLAASGIKEMTLYRGMSFGSQTPPGLTFDGEPHATTVSQQPASSWSYDFGSATRAGVTTQVMGALHGHFDSRGAMLAATVPASRILSTMNSGIGCKTEHEVVVLGGNDQVAAQAWNKLSGRPLSPEGLFNVKTAWRSLESKAYDPDQPRDERGRWAGTGVPSLPNPEEGSYFPGSPAAGTAAAESAHNTVDEAINDMTASKQEYKARISQEIGDRLEGSAAFNDYAHSQAEAFREHPYQNWSGSEPMQAPARSVAAERAWAASNLIQSWAGSSGDNHVIPAALQRAVKEEFGLKDATTDHLLSGPSWEKSAGDLKWELRQEYAKNGDAYRAFARAMYDNTQADLDSKGITEMTLYRGMSFDTGVGGVTPHPTVPDPKTGLIFDGREHAVTTTEQPASSWSYSFHQASGFAPTESGTGAMLAATVPASRILSTMNSGWGCKDEKEVVVLGGKDEVNSWAWYGGDKDGFPPSEPGDLVHTKIVWLALEFKAFNEDQPRDEYGRWTTVGGNAMAAPDTAMGDEDVRSEQYRAEHALDDPNLNPNFFKGAIVRDLSNRLRGNAAWQNYVARTPQEVLRSGETRMHHAVNGMLGMWAGSSGDSNILAVTMQQAVNEEFGLKARTDHMPTDNPKFAEYYTQNGAAYRAFAREMYNATQEELKRDGISQMTLYRGVRFREPDQVREAGFNPDAQSHAATIGQQPASSWSYSFRTAYKFSGGSSIPGAMLAATVPASRILSTMKTGFGCKNEQEVVLLGSTDDKVAAHAWGYTPTGAPRSAAELIHTKLGLQLFASISVWEAKVYDPAQPRDEGGRWTSEPGSATSVPTTEDDVVDAAVRNEHLLNRSLNDSKASAPAYKGRIAEELGARLASSDIFIDYAVATDKMFGMVNLHSRQDWEDSLVKRGIQPGTPQWNDMHETLATETASKLVAGWAQTSGDSSASSIAMQMAIKAEFNLGDAALAHFNKDALGQASSFYHDYPTQGALRSFVRAMYDNTQADLKAKGITEMTLYRGMDFPVDRTVPSLERSTGLKFDGRPHAVETTQQPASSWSYSYAQAHGFVGEHSGAMLAATVPASRILSTMNSGFGCKDEKEVVVLGGKDRVAAQAYSEKRPRTGIAPVSPVLLYGAKTTWTAPV